MSADPNNTDYSQLRHLRQVLAPEYAVLPAAHIRAHMEAAFGEGAADAYNDYLEFSLGDVGRAFSSVARNVGNVVTQVAPAVATIGGGALQGALSGAQFGLPGIIGGLAAGGVGAGLSKYGKGTARDIGGALTGLTGLAGQFSPLGRVGAAVGPAISGLASGGSGGLPGAAVSALTGVLGGLSGGGGAAGALGNLLGSGGLGNIARTVGGGGVAGALSSLVGGGAPGVVGALGSALGTGGASGPAGALRTLFGGSGATGQLMSLLQRPEFAQALGALNLGPMGRKTIPVGSQQIPVPATSIARVAAELADQIATEAAGWSGGAEGDLTYMMNQEGEYVGDPALDRDRAARVWNLLNEAQAERLLEALLSGDALPAESPESAGDFTDWDALDQEYYDSLDMADVYALSYENESNLEYADAESDYER